MRSKRHSAGWPVAAVQEASATFAVLNDYPRPTDVPEAAYRRTLDFLGIDARDLYTGSFGRCIGFVEEGVVVSFLHRVARGGSAFSAALFPTELVGEVLGSQVERERLTWIERELITANALMMSIQTFAASMERERKRVVPGGAPVTVRLLRATDVGDLPRGQA